MHRQEAEKAYVRDIQARERVQAAVNDECGVTGRKQRQACFSARLRAGRICGHDHVGGRACVTGTAPRPRGSGAVFMQFRRAPTTLGMTPSGSCISPIYPHSFIQAAAERSAAGVAPSA